MFRNWLLRTGRTRISANEVTRDREGAVAPSGGTY
jgi:hypothetical protein